MELYGALGIMEKGEINQKTFALSSGENQAQIQQFAGSSPANQGLGFLIQCLVSSKDILLELKIENLLLKVKFMMMKLLQTHIKHFEK